MNDSLVKALQVIAAMPAGPQTATGATIEREAREHYALCADAAMFRWLVAALEAVDYIQIDKPDESGVPATYSIWAHTGDNDAVRLGSGRTLADAVLDAIKAAPAAPPIPEREKGK